MANEFDQFDQANPFDQFDGQKKKPERPTMPALDRFIYGLRQPIDAGTQLGVEANKWLADKGIVPRLPGDPTKGERERKAVYDESKPEGVDWANLAGNIGSPANLALAVIPGGTIPRAAAIGAASGLLTPADEGEDFWSQKAKQAGVGAVGGAAVNAVGRTVARALSPKASVNPDLQMLRSEGVQPTVGQALGGRWNALEEKLQSLPLMGDMIINARGKAREQFNRAAINRATAPIGKNVDEIGTAGVSKAGDLLSDAYDAAKGALTNARLDRQGIRDIRAVQSRVANLPANEQRAFQGLLDRIGTDISPAGRVANFKRVDSTLGKEAAKFSGSTDAYQRELGEQIGNLKQAVSGSVMRSNPQAQAMTKAADKGWANLVRLEGAAVGAKGTDGVFTPGQLMTAVRGADKSVRDRATARGDALLQDLAGAGQNVIGNKVPDSGTAGRLIPWSILTGGGSAGLFVDPVTTAGVVGGLGAGGLLYTGPAQRALVKLVASRGPGWQQAAQILRGMAEHGAPAGAQVGLGLLED